MKLKLSLLTSAATLLLSLTASAAERPNILFIFADDWGRYAGVWRDHESRPSPNAIIKTPNLDRLAREGVFFRNAFVPAPSCTPCRSSLLTGRYFFNTGRGAILETAQWNSAIPTWPLLLRDAGYAIGKSFKVWSPGTPADAPFGAQQFAFQKSGGELNNFSESVTRFIGEGLTLEAARSRLLGQVRGNFDSFLSTRGDKPWCYWFGPTTTHRTWIKGSGKALWGLDPETLQGKLPKFLPDVPEVREDVADYLGEVQALDAYVGVLLDQLATSGELERTLIVVSGDHGMPGVPAGKCNLYDFGTGVSLLARVPRGKGGRVINDFINLMDLAPTLLEAAGVAPPAGINGRSFWDALVSDRSGQIDPTRNFVVTGRERHVAAAREGNLPYPMRALRTADFLYIRNFAPDRWPMGAPAAVTDTTAPDAATLETETRAAFADMDAGPTKAWLIGHRSDPQWKWHYDFAFGKRPAEELYDLRKNPEQTQNVAADPAYAAHKTELAERLLATLTSAGDPRVTGDGQTFDRPPFTDAPPRAPRQPAKKATTQ